MIAIIGTQQAAIQSHDFRPIFFPSLGSCCMAGNLLVVCF